MGLGQAEALSEASPSMRRRGSSTISQSAWGLRASSPPTRPTCRPRSSWASTGRCARATAGRRTRSTARSTAACSVLMRPQSRRANQRGPTPPWIPLHPLTPCTPPHTLSRPLISPHVPSHPLTTPHTLPCIPLYRRARRSEACRSSARSARATTTPRSRWLMRSTTGGRRRRWASRRRARCARRSAHPYTPLEPLASLTPLHPFTLLHLLTGVRDDPLGLARAGPPGRDRLAGGDGEGHGPRRHPAQRPPAGVRADHQ